MVMPSPVATATPKTLVELALFQTPVTVVPLAVVVANWLSLAPDAVTVPATTEELGALNEPSLFRMMLLPPVLTSS